jgi:8-oxo-dGTP diphosphatase
MTRPETPLLTVDIIIEYRGGLVLVERKNPPFGWALPGGFVDVGEPIEHAAVREAREETSLDITLRELFYVYGKPSRDARGHTASIVFIAEGAGTLDAGDDAKGVAVFFRGNLPETIVFDHKEILEDYFNFKEKAARPTPRFDRPK